MLIETACRGTFNKRGEFGLCVYVLRENRSFRTISGNLTLQNENVKSKFMLAERDDKIKPLQELWHSSMEY